MRTVKKQDKIRKPETKPTNKTPNQTRIYKKHLFHITFLVTKPRDWLTNNLVNSVSIKLSSLQKLLRKLLFQQQKAIF